MPQESTTPTSPAKRRRWMGLAQIAAIVAAVAVALYLAQAPERVDQGSTAASTQATPVVSVVHPATTTHVLTVRVTGTVRAQRRTRVRAEVDGRVVWVSPDFNEGGMIPANMPFIRIDPRTFEIDVEMARMAVAEAEAERAIVEAEVEESIRLFVRDNPGADIPDALRRAPWVERAQARLGQAQAALELAELQLARTAISLPFDAQVIATDVEVGEMAGPAATAGRSSKLGLVYRRNALQVRAPIDPADLSMLAPVVGRSARVHTALGSYEARVVRASSVVAPESRLTAVFLEFAEPGSPTQWPLPGTFARVDITGPEQPGVYLLPESAARDQNTVWVVRNGVLNMESPETVTRTAAGWVVREFDAGDGVVVGALAGVSEGMKVVPTSVSTEN